MSTEQKIVEILERLVQMELTYKQANDAILTLITEEQPKKLCPECGHPISEHDIEHGCFRKYEGLPICSCNMHPADLKPAEPKKFSEMSSCEYLGCKYASRDEKGKPYCKDTNEYKNAAGEPVCGLRDDALIMEEKHCTDPSEQVYCLHIIPSEEVCGDCPRWGQPTPTMPPIESGDTQKTIFTPDYHTGFKVGVMRQRDADMAWHNAELDRIAEGMLNSLHWPSDTTDMFYQDIEVAKARCQAYIQAQKGS